MTISGNEKSWRPSKAKLRQDFQDRVLKFLRMHGETFGLSELRDEMGLPRDVAARARLGTALKELLERGLVERVPTKDAHHTGYRAVRV